MGSYKKYYDTFLSNSIIREEFDITLNDEQIYRGVPTMGSGIPDADNPCFQFKSNSDGKAYNIPFSKIKNVEKVSGKSDKND